MQGITATAALLVEGFLKTTLVLVPALLGAAACRRRPASFRHFLLSFALIGLLFLPLFRLLPGGWKTPLLPARPAAAVSPSAVFSSPPPAALSGASAAVSFLSVRDGSPSSRSGESAAGPSNAPTGGRAVPAAVSGAAGGFFPAHAAVFAWFAGFLFLLLKLAFGLVGAYRLTREGWEPGDRGWRILIARFLAVVPLRRGVRLKSHPEVAVPLTWGWRKPVVLIPVGADAWEEAERSAALFHELSHIKRADFLFLLLVRLSLAVFWWNPLCWLAYARLRKEQEIACDELVLRAGIKPSIYAAGLLAFRSSADFRGRASTAGPGLLGGPFFKDRLAAILRQKQTFKEVKMKSRIMLAALVVLAIAFIGTARPAVAGNAASSSGAPVDETLSAAAPAAAQEVKAEKETIKEKEKEKTALKEKEKKKEKEKTSVKTIMVTAGGDKDQPIEITVTGEGQIKKLLLDKPLTLKTGEDGRITFSVEGKEVTVPKGGTISIRGAGGALRFIKEGRIVQLEEGEAADLAGDGDKIVVIEKPGEGGSKHTIVKEIRIKKGEAGRAIEIGKEIKAGEQPVKVIIEEHGKGKPGVVWTTAGEGPAALAVIGERDLLEKVKAIREKAEAVKAKTLEFEELEKSLKNLEAELKDAEDRLKNITVRIDQGEDVRIVREDEAGKKSFVWIEAGDAGKDGEPMKVVCRRDAGTLEITLTGMKGPEGRSVHDRALARIKRELPKEAMLLDSNFDEGGGKMTFKLEVPAETATDKDFVDTIIDIVSEETKK